MDKLFAINFLDFIDTDRDAMERSGEEKKTNWRSALVCLTASILLIIAIPITVLLLLLLLYYYAY